MRYWWVNQNKTFEEEFSGGYMWSPQESINGRAIQAYSNMTEVLEGDVVFSFKGKKIVAIGMISKRASAFEKPKDNNFEKTDWNKTGWKVEVEYKALETQIEPMQHMDILGELLPAKHAPLQKNGRGVQAYLFEISEDMFIALQGLIGNEVSSFLNTKTMEDLAVEGEFLNNVSTDKVVEGAAMVKIRKAQGTFRNNLMMVEKACRVTSISKKEHLIASHIKPWRLSTNDEKIDGNNGLLLAPHIDHLFDKGYLSFGENGDMLVSSAVDEGILAAWGITIKNVGSFSEKQRAYLEFHRKNIFIK